MSGEGGGGVNACSEGLWLRWLMALFPFSPCCCCFLLFFHLFNDEPPSSYGNLLFTGNSKIGPQSDRGEEGARGVMPKKTGHFL